LIANGRHGANESHREDQTGLDAAIQAIGSQECRTKNQTGPIDVEHPDRLRQTEHVDRSRPQQHAIRVGCPHAEQPRNEPIAHENSLE
jgi:hypothetical protein